MFRTPVKPVPLSPPLGIKQPVLSMGSCFADVMGERMRRCKFKTLINPFGVLYHPMALFRVLQMAKDQVAPDQDSYLQHQDIYYNYHFHSKLAHTSKEQLTGLIEQRLQQVHQFLQQEPFIILTFGTAYQYTLKEQDLAVANCHKQPGHLFDKQITSVEHIVQGFKLLMERIGDHQMLVSVSPVRHLKDGLVENSLSKSALRVACQQMAEGFPNVHYFPGFEIVMDDLRDYRFYGKDMIHPNDIAHDYIWDLFVKYFLDQSTQEFLDQWQQIEGNLNHKAFHQHSSAHQEFLKNTLAMLQKVPSYIDVAAEIKQIKGQLL